MSARQVALTALALAAPLGAHAAVEPVATPPPAHFKITSAAAEGPGKVMCVDTQTVSFVLKSCQSDGDACIPNEGQMSLGTVSVDCSDATEQRFGIGDKEVSFHHTGDADTRYIVRATNKENGRFIESAPFQPGATSADATEVQMKGNDMQNPPLEVWTKPDLQKAYQFLSEDCGPNATAPLYYTDWLQDPDGKAKLSISPGPKPTGQELLNAYNNHCNTETALHTAHTVNGERDPAWVSITGGIETAKSAFDGNKTAANSAVAAFTDWGKTQSVRELQAIESTAKNAADAALTSLNSANGTVYSIKNIYDDLRERYVTWKTNFAPYYQTYLDRKADYDNAVIARVDVQNQVSTQTKSARDKVATEQGIYDTAQETFTTASDTVTRKLATKNEKEAAYKDAKPDNTDYDVFIDAVESESSPPYPFTHGADALAEVPQPSTPEGQANANLVAAEAALTEYMAPFSSGRRRLGASSTDALAALSGGRRLEEAISPCTHDICGRQLNAGPDPAIQASLQDAIDAAQEVVTAWGNYNDYVRDRTERAIVAAYEDFVSARQEHETAVGAADTAETTKKNAATALSNAQAELRRANTDGGALMLEEDGNVNTAYKNWMAAFNVAFYSYGGNYMAYGPFTNWQGNWFEGRPMDAAMEYHTDYESEYIVDATTATRAEFDARLAYGKAAADAHTEEKDVHDAARDNAKNKVRSALAAAADLQTSIETALVTHIKTFEENLVAPSGALSLYWTDELDLRAKHGEVETAEEFLKTTQVELQNAEYPPNDVAESDLTEADFVAYEAPTLAPLPTFWRPPCQSEDPVPDDCPRELIYPANLI